MEIEALDYVFLVLIKTAVTGKMVAVFFRVVGTMVMVVMALYLW